MGADITAFLLIDDNTPSDQPPFTNDPLTWDLTHDLGLGGSKDYVFYAAIGGICNTTGIEPLFPWRGSLLSKAHASGSWRWLTTTTSAG